MRSRRDHPRIPPNRRLGPAILILSESICISNYAIIGSNQVDLNPHNIPPQNHEPTTPISIFRLQLDLLFNTAAWRNDDHRTSR